MSQKLCFLSHFSDSGDSIRGRCPLLSSAAGLHHVLATIAHSRSTLADAQLRPLS